MINGDCRLYQKLHKTGYDCGAIFVLVGPAIGLAGSAVIIAFIIRVITLFTAMAYADM